MSFDIIKGNKDELLKLTDEEYENELLIMGEEISNILKKYEHSLKLFIMDYLSAKPFNDSYVYFALDNKTNYIKIGHTYNIEEQIQNLDDNHIKLTALITTKGHFNQLIEEELRNEFISYYKGNGWYGMTEADVEEFIVCEWFDCEEDEDGLKHYNYDTFHLTDTNKYYDRLLNNYYNIYAGKKYIKLKGLEACYKSLKTDYEFVTNVLDWCKDNQIGASYLDREIMNFVVQYVI